MSTDDLGRDTRPSIQPSTWLAAAVGRVVGAAGEVVGSGFLIGPTIMATCAHVVAEALGADPYGPAPSAPITVDFPLAAPQQPGPTVAHRATTARVHRWRPIDEDGLGDLALLVLDSPPPAGAKMPPLRRIDRLWGSACTTVGFPADLEDGLWSTGVLRAAQGLGWCQLEGSPGAPPIGPGFSGAPVWHDESAAVIGMTVAVADDPRHTTAYLLPIQDVLGLDPDLLPAPYRGLAPFDEEHAAFFFGRDQVIDRLDRLAQEPGLVVVVGPSGAGKSSLLRAGLLPRVRASGRTVHLHRAGDHDTAEAETAPGDVVLLDQLEELAATDPESAKNALARAAASPATVVATLRTDSLGELLTAELAPVFESRALMVPPMTRDELRSAIVGPASGRQGWPSTTVWSNASSTTPATGRDGCRCCSSCSSGSGPSTTAEW